jgi:hypothetical protein
MGGIYSMHGEMKNKYQILIRKPEGLGSDWDA